MSRLIVVSNRVAPTKSGRSGGEGGLAVAVKAAMHDQGGVWFGWSGRIFDHEPGPPDIFDVGRMTYVLVDLSQRDHDEYYNGYANRTLWPLFHYRLDLTEFSRRNLAGYQRVNRLFANKLQPLLQPDDRIWMHDYHLIPMAEQLRSLGCQQRMGFFLHIPWPSLEILLALPNHRTIVRALCAYDLIGFQTNRDLRAFWEYIELEAGGDVCDDGIIEAFGRRLRAEAFPIGIDTDTIATYAVEAESSRQNRRLKESLRGRKLVIGVDRLDYSKGLVARMESIDHLFKTNPDLRGRVTTMQIAPPSRSDVPEYVEIRQQLEAIVGHVNGTYAEFDWMPIRYLNKGFTRRTLAGFYRLSRVGLVTPLRDGMNLVAKEFIAAQNPEDPGVLVLSRFAGAAEELNNALIVNPYDVEDVADAIRRALIMPVEERRERWQGMFEWLQRHNIVAWQRSFMEALETMPTKSAA
ncbi:MAG: alpha,alpha-trehalose-phosphate synthase (UDP-forming) [Alphaproteobacteria bacterium]